MTIFILWEGTYPTRLSRSEKHQPPFVVHKWIRLRTSRSRPRAGPPAPNLAEACVVVLPACDDTSNLPEKTTTESQAHCETERGRGAQVARRSALRSNRTVPGVCRPRSVLGSPPTVVMRFQHHILGWSVPKVCVGMFPQMPRQPPVTETLSLKKTSFECGQRNVASHWEEAF